MLISVDFPVILLLFRDEVKCLLHLSNDYGKLILLLYRYLIVETGIIKWWILVQIRWWLGSEICKRHPLISSLPQWFR
jgi:hypothetical protein